MPRLPIRSWHLRRTVIGRQHADESEGLVHDQPAVLPNGRAY